VCAGVVDRIETPVDVKDGQLASVDHDGTRMSRLHVAGGTNVDELFRRHDRGSSRE
jgi:hypothetical protein